VRVRAESLRKDLSQAVEDDAAAFEALMGAIRLPKDTEEQRIARDAAVTNATLNAAHIPLHVAEYAVEVMRLALTCARQGNANALSDSLSGFAMARAALTAAASNVRINLNALEDKSLGEKMLSKLVELEEQADTLENEIRSVAP